MLGGNQMACPAIRRLRDHGYRIIVVDGKADAPGGQVADCFIHQNFLDVDSTMEILSGVDFDGIIPLNDFAIHAAAQIARKRNLPGWNALAESCFTSKVVMKQAWSSHGLATAAWSWTTAAELRARCFPDWHSWPAVIKPSYSGGGSRGVFVAKNWAEVLVGFESVEERYLDGDIVIEEFIDGSEHTIEVLISNGQPMLLSISDKENYPGSETIVRNLYFPGPVGHHYKEQIQSLLFAACAAMQLTDGTTHFEVLVRNHQPFLLEVGGRPGGGLNFHPICELSTGYDYPGLLAAVVTGRTPDYRRQSAEHLAWHYFSPGTGTLEAIEGFDFVRQQEDVVEAEIYEVPGQSRFLLKDDLSRPGYVLVRGASHAAACARATELVAQVKFRIEPNLAPAPAYEAALRNDHHRSGAS